MYELNNLLMSSFSQWLKNNRKKSGFTLEQLRSAIGDICTVAYLSKLENDKYKSKKGEPMRPDREIVVALAEAFHENIDNALHLAGYAVSSESFPKLPSFLHQINWLEFTKDELFAVERFIGFLMYERHRTHIMVKEGVKELFSHVDDNKLNNFKKTG
jgi:transcriptional regulator with XRE-family HTH domain